MMITAFSVFFSSCENPMTAESSDNAAGENDSKPSMYYDSSKDAAVFVDESGMETLIQSDEESGSIVCKQVIDYAIPRRSDYVSKNSISGDDDGKAFILGKRRDGRFGLWHINRHGEVKLIIGDGEIETSELLEKVEKLTAFTRHFGWSYEAVDLVFNEERKELIIVGYAINEKGFDFREFEIEPGTTIGVYWAISQNRAGFYRISGAKVIGVREIKDRRDKNHSLSDLRHNTRRNRHQVKPLFRWYDSYLSMTDSVEPDEAEGEYMIYGTDQDEDQAVAIVTAKEVLSIEKSSIPPDDENQAPDARFPSADYAVENAETDEVNQNYTFDQNFNAKPSYLSDGAPEYRIFAYDFGGSTNYWLIDLDSDGVTPADISEVAYFVRQIFPTVVPPISGWYRGSSYAESALRLLEYPISGDVSSSGNELAVHYIYEDAEDDPEGDTLFQWYRCVSGDDEGTAISGATEEVYTTVSDDEGCYLKVEVTPVDSNNNAGDTVKSDASRQIGSS